MSSPDDVAIEWIALGGDVGRHHSASTPLTFTAFFTANYRRAVALATALTGVTCHRRTIVLAVTVAMMLTGGFAANRIRVNEQLPLS